MKETKTTVPTPSFEPPEEPQWHRLISETAYFIAERRGFKAGHALSDWLEAEQLVKDQLQGGGEMKPAMRAQV